MNEAVKKFEIHDHVEILSFNSNIVTIQQIVNCIIRYSVIQFPLCMKTFGILNGSCIISIIALMSIFSIFLIIEIHLKTKFE